ncbi:hypothetical protein [Acrocarpospora phusangensis]|uniref:hypothetical protein n=1 Tax=Acrocarpospora phusangensis TaxID=1070424 RepID=UPI00194DBE3D|nr:hypothetical protein [Acrocarpospora phusangensis]
MPAKVKPDALLEAVQLADPTAAQDGEELLAAGTRIHAPLELTADLLRKLSIEDEERLWAYRVVAERPLPMDYYDKFLAAGIAYRYGGWSLCEGSADDPAEDDSRLAAVYLPEMPDQEELAALLRGLLRLPEATETAETTEATEAAGTTAEAETEEAEEAEVAAAEETASAEAASEEAASEEAASTEAASESAASDETTPEAGSEAATDDTASEEAASEEEVDEPGKSGLVVQAGQSIVYTGADIQVTASYETRFPAVVAGLLPYATEVVRIAVRALEDGELEGDDLVLEPGKVALALGSALDGPVVDAWGFQILEAEDLLPARRA